MTEEELRLNAIERYVNGENPKSIYNELGRIKPWFYKWLKRYLSGGPHWYPAGHKYLLLCVGIFKQPCPFPL